MIKLLRQHLKKNTNLMDMLDNNNSIYYIDKPVKCNDKTYLVIKDKLIGLDYIKDVQLIFHVLSPSPQICKEIETELIDYLHDERGENIIKNDDTVIRNIRILNGGGIIHTPENDYLSVVYFIAKI